MGFFDIFHVAGMDQLLEQYSASQNAILLDVRTPQEFGTGHLPGSRNLPLSSIGNIHSVAHSKDIPLFVYCQSGVRSRQAASRLKKMGYINVNDLGSISRYSGELVR